MIKIKANEELFERWKVLGLRITRQNAIVQNDMEMEDELEFLEWCNVQSGLLQEFRTLGLDTASYVKKSIRKKT